ncbi:MAG: ferric reductase-like transmembrane domain-containing protein [bacterium]|nr:ferric reductase-like transmembrane domain-containing protein [bacterium]
MDIKNTPIQHLIVGVFSLALVGFLKFILETPWSTSFGRVSFILLFLILTIGPLMRLKKPTKSSSPLTAPWSWRGELGIWFTLTALTHFIITLIDRPLSNLIKIGGAGFGLANLIGLVALFWALFLAATSFGKVILFLGVGAWKWLHSLTYVVFYLVTAHFIYFQFFSTYGEIGPDWFGYTAVIMAMLIIALQLIAFIVTITKQQKEKSIE